jgi:peroxiredoxin
MSTKPNQSMLQPGQMIPPLTLHPTNGRTIRTWDFKQKKNVVIAFLHADCPDCEAFVRSLSAANSLWKANDAVILAATLAQPSRNLSDLQTDSIIVGLDPTGRAAIAYAGKESLGATELIKLGVFAADRYGELAAKWDISANHNFPDPSAIASILEQSDLAR